MNLKSCTFEEAFRLINNNLKDDSHFIFDCDGTLIKNDICQSMCAELLRNKRVAKELLPPELESFKIEDFDLPLFKELHKKMSERLSLEEIFVWEIKCASGLHTLEARTFALESVKNVRKNGFLLPRQQVYKLARHFADRSTIISGSVREFVSAIAREVNIPYERIIATELEQDSKQCLIPKIKGKGFVWEEIKLQRYLEERGKAPYFVAGDSMGDWHILEAATDFAWIALTSDSPFNSLLIQKLKDEVGLSTENLNSPSGLYVYQENNSAKQWFIEID